MGQSEEKTVRKEKKTEQPNTLFISFVPINALRLLKKKTKKTNKQTRTA